jgi:dTDP-4-dehydrorhamnose 3,5-epimerase
MLDIQDHPEIPDIKIVSNKVFQDKRGWFTETYRTTWEAQLKREFSYDWLQENVSSSSKNTLRGLHYQIESPQAKWIRVLHGEVLDVAVDLRKNSATFGKSITYILRALEGESLIIPVGFAHGFLAKSETVIFSYKCSDFYHPSGERGIVWNDPILNIDWGTEKPEVSEKDVKLPLFSSLPDKDLF